MPPKKSARLSSRKNAQSEWHVNRAASRASTRAVPASDSSTAGSNSGRSGQPVDIAAGFLPPSTHVFVQATVPMVDNSVQTSVESNTAEIQATVRPADASAQSVLISLDSTSDILCQVYHTVQLHLPGTWFIQLKNNFLNLITLYSYQDKGNVRTEKCVTFSESGIEIFIHGHPLLNNHDVYAEIAEREMKNVQAVSKTLLNIVVKLDSYKICSGTNNERCHTVYNEGVFAQRVVIEEGFAATRTYRSTRCSLLVGQNSICEFCRFERNNMVRRSKLKAAQDADRSLYGVNLKYYTREELRQALKSERSDNRKGRRQKEEIYKSESSASSRDREKVSLKNR